MAIICAGSAFVGLLLTACERRTDAPPPRPSVTVSGSKQADAGLSEPTGEDVAPSIEPGVKPEKVNRSPQTQQGKAADAVLLEHYETMLEKQREYDRSRRASTVAEVLARMEEHMKAQPIRSMLPFLHHQEWEIRHAVARAFIGRPEACRQDVRLALTKAARTDKNPYSLPQMLQAIAYTRAKEATDVLSAIVVNHENAGIRRAAADAQYWIRDPRAVSALLEATSDRDGDVVNRAVWALAHIADAKALPRIRALAFGGKSGAQPMAVQALGIMRDSESGEELIQLLTSTDEGLLVTAISSLGLIGYEGAVSALVPFLDHDNKNVEQAALEALCGIGNREVLRCFLERYSASLEDALLLRAIAEVYGRCDEQLEDLAETVSEAERSRLARHLSLVLPRSKAKELPEAVRPEHIRGIKQLGEWRFVWVDFGRRGVSFLARKDRKGNWTSVRTLGVWIE